LTGGQGDRICSTDLGDNESELIGKLIERTRDVADLVVRA
jgi:hypothetical protein